MKLSLFDLHCDTAFMMHRHRQPLMRNDFAISLENARKFEQYVQVMAIWTDPNLSDADGWQAFGDILRTLKEDASVQHHEAELIDEIPLEPIRKPSLLLAVEDARILCGDASRLEHLYQNGVRILTPLWKGKTSIGGSHDTKEGLTPFGKTAIFDAMKLGMLIDISHASVASAEEIFSCAESLALPVIATHSNAYELCSASRNLHRAQAIKILKSGGVVGLNLYPPFLKKDGIAHVEDVVDHAEYFLDLGFEDHLCLGCDMDGADMPPEVQNLSVLDRLANAMLSRRFSERLVQKIFFENARRFFQHYVNKKIT